MGLIALMQDLSNKLIFLTIYYGIFYFFIGKLHALDGT